MTNFDKFWQAYPKRNGKKVSRYPCLLWFKAEKPTDEEVQQMIDWIAVDNENRRARQKEFYAPLPDAIRFLRYRMWEDPIESIKKNRKVDKCDLCDNPATSINYSTKTKRCPRHPI